MLPSDPVPRFARERILTKGAAKKLAFKRLETYPRVQ
jgi:hypothetical protein